jgi:hypothetical protein
MLANDKISFFFGAGKGLWGRDDGGELTNV